MGRPMKSVVGCIAIFARAYFTDAEVRQSRPLQYLWSNTSYEQR